MDTQEYLQQAAQASAKTPRPAKFPATLDDFLRLIVCAKTPDDMSRFREFLRYRVERSYASKEYTGREGDAEENPDLQALRNEHAARWKALDSKKRRELVEAEADGLITRYRERGIGHSSPAAWDSFANDYLNWWKAQRSQKARASAMQRKRARKANKKGPRKPI
jgi:hypothetical protein